MKICLCSHMHAHELGPDPPYDAFCERNSNLQGDIVEDTMMAPGDLPLLENLRPSPRACCPLGRVDIYVVSVGD